VGEYARCQWGESLTEIAEILYFISIIRKGNEYIYFRARWYYKIEEDRQPIVDSVFHLPVFTPQEKPGYDLVRVRNIEEHVLRVHHCPQVAFEDINRTAHACKEAHVDTDKWVFFGKMQGFQSNHNWTYK
jgi:hypothetical protein